MVFHSSFSDCKSPQISRTLLSILTDLNNAMVWMVSTRPHISKSSNPFINSLVIVLSAPTTIGLTVTVMFHSFFQCSNKVHVLNLLFAFLQFYSVVSRNCKIYNLASSLFLLFIIRSGCLAEIR